MRMLRVWAYLCNASEQAQTLRHPSFATNGGLLSVVPGGLVLAESTTITLEPGQIVKLPIGVFCESGNKQSWGKEVSEEEFFSAVAAVQAANAPATFDPPEASDAVEPSDSDAALTDEQPEPAPKAPAKAKTSAKATAKRKRT